MAELSTYSVQFEEDGSGAVYASLVDEFGEALEIGEGRTLAEALKDLHELVSISRLI